jgi:hypothetical protein
MFNPRFLAVGTIALLLAVLVAPSISLAHERRTIGNGKYDVVVGWDVEPAYQNQKNAAGIRISRAGTNPAEPVTGAEKTLKVEMRQGATTRTFDLRAVGAQPGYYLADILPTREGDYQWTFVGSIGDDQINEKFDTADGKFNAIQSAAALQFPVTLPDPAQVAADAAATRSATQSAQTLAMIGIGVGLLGLVVALAVWFTRPKATSSGVRAARPASERAS